MKRILTMLVFLFFALLAAISALTCPLFMLYGLFHLAIKKENKLYYFTSLPPRFAMSVAYLIIDKIDNFIPKKQ